MAYQARLATWLTNHRKSFELRIREFEWPKVVNFRNTDFEVTLIYDGETFVGRGTDADPNFALEKACAEAVERLVCSRHGISSLGVALHTNQLLAKQNARFEYIERRVLDHHINRIVPVELSSRSVSAVPASDDKIERCIYKLSKCGDIETNLCVISCRDIRLIGAAAAFGNSDASARAELEAIRNLAAYISDAERFQQAVSANLNLKWSDSCFFHNKIAPFLLAIGQADDLPAPTIGYKHLSLPNESIFAECPAVVFQAFEKSAV